MRRACSSRTPGTASCCSTTSAASSTSTALRRRRPRRHEPRRRADARRHRRARRLAEQRPGATRCRPTTTRCCGASWRSFPTGASRANAASPWSARRGRDLGDACDRSSPARSPSRSVAVHRDWMPRNLMVADAEPRASSTSRTRCTARSSTTSPAAARRLHLVGRGAGDRLGGALLGGGAQGRPAGATATSATSGARSSGWACSATSRCSASSARLKHRDAKPAYSADLPRFFAYAHKVASRYSELRPLAPPARAADGRRDASRRVR